MAEIVLFKSFFIALALGALIGLEREYARYRMQAQIYAGIRTFPLIALFGALAAYFGDRISQWILVVGILLIGLLIITAYFVRTRNKKQKQSTGATSEVAGLITFFIGVLSYYNEIKLASVVTVVMVILLYARSLLHNFAKKMKRTELADTLKFAVVALVILPFLPNKGYGPLEFFNPYTFWLIVVFVSAISFMGYIMMKWLGEKGIAVTGFLGGIASSTAVTTTFAQRSAREPAHARSLARGVVIANGIMFLRVLVVVSVLNQNLLRILFLPFLLLAGLTAVLASIVWWKTASVKSKITLTSPFTLLPALKFGVIFAVTTTLLKIAHNYFSSRGIYAVSFLSGLADVDAVTVSVAQLMPTALSAETALVAVFIATLTNILAKGGIAYWFGNKEFGRIVAACFAVIIIVGVGVLFFLKGMY